MLFVIDTNYLIHALDFIMKLHELHPCGLLIPYAVVQELDGLKISKKEARRAIDFLYRNDKIRIQKLDESVSHPIHPDDQILDCCLFAIQRISHAVYFMCNGNTILIRQELGHQGACSRHTHHLLF
jgi:predicted ribonuclease YlaK